jgi:hypothetical protein
VAAVLDKVNELYRSIVMGMPAGIVPDKAIVLWLILMDVVPIRVPAIVKELNAFKDSWGAPMKVPAAATFSTKPLRYDVDARERIVLSLTVRRTRPEPPPVKAPAANDAGITTGLTAAGVHARFPEFNTATSSKEYRVRPGSDSMVFCPARPRLSTINRRVRLATAGPTSQKIVPAPPARAEAP